jgi:hypothetical protein
MKESLKIIFLYPGETLLMKTLTAGKQKAVGSTRKLLQYCQLSDKNSRDILRDLQNFSQYIKSFMYLLHDFSLYPIDVLGSSAWETLAFTMERRKSRKKRLLGRIREKVRDTGADRGGGGSTPPPKFRSFDKVEPNSQFCGKYVRNNLTRIRLSLIFLVVS